MNIRAGPLIATLLGYTGYVYHRSRIIYLVASITMKLHLKVFMCGDCNMAQYHKVVLSVSGVKSFLVSHYSKKPILFFPTE